MHTNQQPQKDFGMQFLTIRNDLRQSLADAGEEGLKSIILACLAARIDREREIVELISGIGGRYYADEVHKLIEREQSGSDPAWLSFATSRLYPLR